MNRSERGFMSIPPLLPLLRYLMPGYSNFIAGANRKGAEAVSSLYADDCVRAIYAVQGVIVILYDSCQNDIGCEFLINQLVLLVWMGWSIICLLITVLSLSKATNRDSNCKIINSRFEKSVYATLLLLIDKHH